jgi:glycosyltransferase involved in cell wall biosynthesis
MSAYNAEDFIKESIESVLNQSFSDFEFIIVNDGSTDNSRSIIGSYNDKRIRLIDNNHDYIQSLNKGLRASKGKYIARMDADDIMHVDRLKLQHSMMEEFPEITVYSSWETVFGEKMPKRIFEQKLSGLIELPLVQLLLGDLRINPIYTIRKSFIVEHHLLYESYAYSEDYKFVSEIAKLSDGFYIDSQPLVYRRICDTKISRRRREEQIQTTLKIKKEILHLLCNKYNAVYPALMDLYGSCYKLLEQKLISENDIFLLFHSLFMKNKDTFKSLEINQK